MIMFLRIKVVLFSKWVFKSSSSEVWSPVTCDVWTSPVSPAQYDTYSEVCLSLCGWTHAETSLMDCDYDFLCVSITWSVKLCKDRNMWSICVTLVAQRYKNYLASSVVQKKWEPTEPFFWNWSWINGHKWNLFLKLIQKWFEQTQPFIFWRHK